MYELLLALFFALASCPLAFFTSCCCGSICPRCSSRPASYQAVIAGIANGSCVVCNNYNGTYIVPLSTAVDINECTCQMAIDSASCGTSTFAYFIRVQASLNGAQTRLRCTMVMDGPGNAAEWYDDIGADPANCSAVSGLSLTLRTNFGAYCDSTAATATITAL